MLDAGDRSFGPGRVAAIVKGATKPADLARICGGRNVRFGMITEAEGMEQHGALIYQGEPHELQAGFTEDGQQLDFVRVVGRAGATKEGLCKGTTPADLGRLKGGPFPILGSWLALCRCGDRARPVAQGHRHDPHPHQERRE